MTIKWSHNDTQKVRRLRECLSNRSVNIDLLEDLLSTLEGKITPSNVQRQQRKPSRVARHMDTLMGAGYKKTA